MHLAQDFADPIRVSGIENCAPCENSQHIRLYTYNKYRNDAVRCEKRFLDNDETVREKKTVDMSECYGRYRRRVVCMQKNSPALERRDLFCTFQIIVERISSCLHVYLRAMSNG